MKRKRRVSSRVFKFTLDLMGRHLKFEAARNSVFSSRDIHSCLVHLSLNEGYAEGGMANLSSKCSLSSKAPTGRTFRNRVERVEAKEVRRSLNEANDEVLRTLKGLGVFRRRAVVAIDYVRKPYYGDPNAEMVVGGPYLMGTPWYHCYASIHLVEAGRRITLYTMPIHQFTEKARVVERLIEEAKRIGVHVGLVLLDRAFFTVEVITTLKKLWVRFIMPAVKNRRVKDAISRHHRFEAEPIQRFTLGRGDRAVGLHLAIYPKPREKAEKIQRLYDRYLTFATNISKPRAGQFSILIPKEYRRRWGIETGFRVQGTIEAKTTSKNHALRLLYHIYSVVLYNIWQYANLLLAKALRISFTKPILTVGNLATYLDAFILGGLGPPRP